MSLNVSLGLSQVDRIAQLCDFLAHPGMRPALDDSVPVSMPHDVGSLGFDTPLWVGLGMVGLWSALDAFAERAGIAPVKCSVCDRKNCLSSRLTNTSKLNVVDERALKEMEDVRHLFAHNYAGRADSVYFDPKWKRHVLDSGVSVSLSSGALFDGATIALTAAHLQYYANQSRDIIGKLL